MTRDSAVELRSERAVRSAARLGNRLLAGRTASVALSNAELQRELARVLRSMGVRLRTADDQVDFAFVDHADPAPNAAVSAGRGGRSHGLPGVRIGLDGSTESLRAADAESRIAWAVAGMPATAALADEVRAAASHRDDGARIGVSLVLEPKTAAFARMLADAGCEVAVFSAVSETDPEIAAALASDGRVAVFAPQHAVDAANAAEVDARHAVALLDWAPAYLVDDGAHLLRLAHTEQRTALAALRGVAEETTSGVRPVHEMASLGALRVPVIAVNDARTKTDFDNRIGTGQSCVFAIGEVRDHAAAGHDYRGVMGEHWVVYGYGPVGQGVARFAAALGARITVVERDAVRALSAVHDGYEAATAAASLPTADVVVSATGVWHTIGAAAFALMPAGAVVAVAGGIDDELALDELRDAGWRPAIVGPDIMEWRAPGADGPGPRVLAGGGGINYTAAEGNPIEVMDLSFATQLSAIARLIASEDAEPRLHSLSAAAEDRVARAALDALGASVEPSPVDARPGGAAQHWTVHRYRAGASEPNALHSNG
ncbi:adenosylhomocysteinase [Leucobacter japonicus]|uniref:adenosylhomocysteinase n=1 Tax=Leucobacter japonicus TaxID=1461259 RepID=UPI000AB9CA78|nr:adenosylhomocysteinase [Leucobacter japonicus]